MKKLLKVACLLVLIVGGAMAGGALVMLTGPAAASRDASGTYTLPVNSENPAVFGTPISPTDHNSTMNDIKAELTDSLSRSGKGGMTARLVVKTTSGSTQGLFGPTGDAPIGLYSHASNPAVASNATNDGTTGWKYATSNSTLALLQEFGSNGWIFYTAPIGTSGNAVTFTERFRVSTSGANISTGVATDGSGFKHQSVAGCTTAASVGATCSSTLTWATTFADASYHAFCGCNGTTGVPVVASWTVAAGSVGITTAALTASAATCTNISCLAVHN